MGDEDTGLVWLEVAVGRQREKTGQGRQQSPMGLHGVFSAKNFKYGI